jgi:23S rRNA pseudouridine1911/1915/1917 synthase
MGADYRVEGGQGPDADDVVDAPEVESREVEVDASGHGERLDRFLTRLAPEFSRNHLQSLVERGCVSLDGRVADSSSRKLRAGQRLRVDLQPTDESRAFRAEEMALDIVFEDDAMLVVNKPAGLVVHPAAGNWSGTLMNGLLAHHPPVASLPRAGIVHRLDKDTSGLMVVGKSLEGVTALSRMIAAREVHREYLALAYGTLADPIVIDVPLRRDPISRVKMAVAPSEALGKSARTDVYPVGVGLAAERSISGVHCVLHSGRTHQIRVHLAYRGHPLVADELYGGAPALGLVRQALHAARLSFNHPLTGEPMQFVAPLPVDLAAAWAALGLPAWPAD